MLSTLESIGGLGGYYKVVRQGEEMALTLPTGGVRPVFQGDYDFALRNSILKDAEIDIQLLLCEQGFGGCPYVLFNTNVRLCQLYNDAVANIQKESPNYIGCAEVPPQNPEAAITELKRAVTTSALKQQGLTEIGLERT
jgi:predicted TIM-barrel fold metal-dependent hydrolase